MGLALSAKATWAISNAYRPLVMENHRVDEALVGVLAVFHQHLRGGHHAFGVHVTVTHALVVHALLVVVGGLFATLLAALLFLAARADATSGSQRQGDREQEREQPEARCVSIQDLFPFLERVEPYVLGSRRGSQPEHL